VQRLYKPQGVFLWAHGRGGVVQLLRGHPKMTSYEIAVECGPDGPEVWELRLRASSGQGRRG
jgi:hypothetical protein